MYLKGCIYFHFSKTVGKYSALWLDTMFKAKYKEKDNVGVIFYFYFLFWKISSISKNGQDGKMSPYVLVI